MAAQPYVDAYGNYVDPTDQPDTGSPYFDPANFANAGQPTPNQQGGYPNAPPDYNNTGAPQPGWGFDPNSNGWTFSPPPAAPAAGGGGGLTAYGGPKAPDYSFYTSPPPFDWNAPAPFSYDPFSAPTGDQVFQDPGYQFRLGQGRQALEQSAAGKGLLRTGGTLKDILGYGQNLASQEYGNVFNRAAQTYGTNRNNAYQNYAMNYNDAFQNAQAKYAPQFAGWQQQENLGKNAADAAFKQAYDQWIYNNPSADTILSLGQS